MEVAQGMRPLRVDFPYLVEDEDRHGKARVYVRRYGRKIRIRAKKGTVEFAEAYAAGLRKLARPVEKAPVAPTAPSTGTLGWLAALYYGSDEFDALDKTMRRQRRNIIDSCLEEPDQPDSPRKMRDCPLSDFGADHAIMLRDRKAKAGLKGAANNRKKYLSAMFGWAVEKSSITGVRSNPLRDVKRVQYATTGFHTWTLQEIRQYEARHPIGTKARMVLALLLFLGDRGGDIVKLGRQHVRDGWICHIPRKMSYKRQRELKKPIIPALSGVMSASPEGSLTFLETEYGQPFTAKGFQNWFRDRCDEAGLHHCTAHGLRKAAATIAAENGATVNQLMAIFDWDTPQQARVYTEAADRKRLAGESMHLLATHHPSKAG